MRYFLDSDDDGHWYLIPEHCRDTWLSCDDYEFFDLDANGVISLGCHPNKVTFSLPSVFGGPVGEWTL